MPYKDPEKRKAYHKEYIKAWDKKNREKRRSAGRKAMQKWRDHNPELSALKMREWRSSNKEKSVSQVNKYKANNPEKTKAHRIVLEAKKKGLIVKLPCQVCGNEKSQAHHDDYSKPLEVIWLCQKHHSEIHKTGKSF